MTIVDFTKLMAGGIAGMIVIRYATIPMTAMVFACLVLHLHLGSHSMFQALKTNVLYHFRVLGLLDDVKKHDEGGGDGDSTANALIVRKPTKLQQFFAYYAQWTASSITSERGIKLAQFITWFISQLTKNMPWGDEADLEHYKKNVSPAFRKMYIHLTTMRYLWRFYGMPSSIDAAMTGSWAAGEWKDVRIKILSHAMAGSMVFYFPLEHLAFLKWNMPNLEIFRHVDGNLMSAWSCRFWLAFIILDWVISYLKNCELRERKDNSTNGDENVKSEGDNQDQGYRVKSKSNELVKELDKSIYLNKVQMIRCALLTSPCVSWSLDNWATDPWLSENTTHSLFLSEAIVCMYQSLVSLKKV